MSMIPTPPLTHAQLELIRQHIRLEESKQVEKLRKRKGGYMQLIQ